MAVPFAWDRCFISFERLRHCRFEGLERGFPSRREPTTALQPIRRLLVLRTADLWGESVVKTFRLFAATAIALVAVPVHAADTGSFSPQRLSQHVQTLGSDAFEGRARRPRARPRRSPISASNSKAGLQPGGDLKDGKRSWTQAVPLLRSEFAAAPQVSLNLAGKPTALTQGEQIAVRAPTNGDKAMTIDGAPLVFVGYGVKAPERGWDDFKGLDCQGQDPGHAGQRPRFRRAAKAISAARR